MIDKNENAKPIDIVVGKDNLISTAVTVRNNGKEASYGTNLTIYSSRELPNVPVELRCIKTEGLHTGEAQVEYYRVN